MNVCEKIEFIRSNPACWTRLGFGFDPPVENENGEFVLFENDFNKYLKVHKEFFDAGVKIHSTLMPSGWMGVDRYNYTVGDRIMDALFSLRISSIRASSSFSSGMLISPTAVK